MKEFRKHFSQESLVKQAKEELNQYLNELTGEFKQKNLITIKNEQK